MTIPERYGAEKIVDENYRPQSFLYLEAEYWAFVYYSYYCHFPVAMSGAAGTKGKINKKSLTFHEDFPVGILLCSTVEHRRL